MQNKATSIILLLSMIISTTACSDQQNDAMQNVQEITKNSDKKGKKEISR